MPNKQREFTPDQLAEAQRLYEQTEASLKAVADFLEISTTTLKNRIALWGWQQRSTRIAPAAKRTATAKKNAPSAKPVPKNPAALKPPAKMPRNDDAPRTVADMPAPLPETRQPSPWQGQPCTGLADCPERTALIARLWASVSRQIARIDAAHAAFVANGGLPNAAEAEGHAKLIAALARTMRELATLDAALQDKSREERAAHDSNSTRNADAFRDELAKRLAALDAGSKTEISGNADAG